MPGEKRPLGASIRSRLGYGITWDLGGLGQFFLLCLNGSPGIGEVQMSPHPLLVQNGSFSASV